MNELEHIYCFGKRFVPNCLIIKINNLRGRYRKKNQIIQLFKNKIPQLKLADFAPSDKLSDKMKEIAKNGKKLQFIYFEDYGIIKRPINIKKHNIKSNPMIGIYIEMKVRLPVQFMDHFMDYIIELLENLHLYDTPKNSDMELEDKYEIIIAKNYHY